MGLSNREGNFYMADDDILRDYQNSIDDELHLTFDKLNMPIDICGVMNGIRELKQEECNLRWVAILVQNWQKYHILCFHFKQCYQQVDRKWKTLYALIFRKL